MTFEWIGTLGTAIVGVAGITATYWSAAKARATQTNNLQFSIGAENERARLVEKRRIYATYMGAISSYVVVERDLADAKEKGLTEDRISVLRADLSRSMTVVLSALCELRLIASSNLAILAVNVVQQLTTSEDTSVKFPESRDELYKVMRADLGEAQYEGIEVAEIVTNAIRR